MEFVINDVKVIFENGENITEDMAKNYLDYAEEHKLYKDATIASLTVTLDGTEADMEYEYVQNKPKIERIRRITGYLSGTTDTWNNSKRAEERDRLKNM
jgi:ribonucleoside-triphosphate reductase